MNNLANRGFTAGRSIGSRHAGATKILLGQNVGCHLRPTCRHLDTAHLEDRIALRIPDDRITQLIGKLIEGRNTFPGKQSTDMQAMLSGRSGRNTICFDLLIAD